MVGLLGGGQLGTTNEAVGERNWHQKEVGKIKFVWKVLKNNFRECIGFINLVITYRKNGCKLWGKTHRYDQGKITGQTQNYVNGKTDLLEVIFHLYHFNYCSFFHLTMLSYNNFSIYWVSLWIITSLSYTPHNLSNKMIAQ